MLTLDNLSKAYGGRVLLDGVSWSMTDDARVGLVGLNGAGKSTLLKIVADAIPPDSGRISRPQRTRVGYLAQDAPEMGGRTVADETLSALTELRALDQRRVELEQILTREHSGPAHESALAELGDVLTDLERHRFYTAESRAEALLFGLGFTSADLGRDVAEFSGGIRMRIALAKLLLTEPEFLMLDEPTNHLDLAGIQWLEELLNQASFACVFVSHDRYFLENVALEMVELNRIYPDGVLRVRGKYSEFLEKKEAFLLAQSKQQDALTNRVHTEMEWLRRGPKARATKAKARIDTANAMIGELAEMKSRSRTASAGIEFSASERQTKRLVEMDEVSYAIGDRTLFKNLNFILTAGMRVGLVGANGSGKTTLLRLLLGNAAPTTGTIRKADALRVVYLDQTRELDESLTLRRALAPDSDSVVYQGRVVHVASWASKFLFTSEQLNQPVKNLSGGERARVLIANLMLQPADLLLLDEPTNDLDIPTLEILEESLLEYPGALVLITHDRYMLDRVSTIVLGLDGQGGAERFADYSQWDVWQTQQSNLNAERSVQTDSRAASAANRKEGKTKLSYLEARELAGLEDKVVAAEDVLHEARVALEEPSIASDGARLLAANAQLERAQDAVDQLYARWAALTEKQK